MRGCVTFKGPISDSEKLIGHNLKNRWKEWCRSERKTGNRGGGEAVAKSSKETIHLLKRKKVFPVTPKNNMPIFYEKEAVYR
ncbi:hypothetical protein F2Q70_00004677 [Brassica cretica]|uniref:Uncharacterized protein n=1 Tax=Brassica cretica TaxID=69181 RepID=A0A8S9IJS9_BRACR|nr:hypothetical protein F2Q70_00004677 [Brassica cretica]